MEMSLTRFQSLLQELEREGLVVVDQDRIELTRRHKNIERNFSRYLDFFLVTAYVDVLKSARNPEDYTAPLFNPDPQKKVLIESNFIFDFPVSREMREKIMAYLIRLKVSDYKNKARNEFLHNFDGMKPHYPEAEEQLRSIYLDFFLTSSFYHSLISNVPELRIVDLVKVYNRGLEEIHRDVFDG